MSEPVYLKDTNDPPAVVMVYSHTLARLLKEQGFVRCPPDPNAVTLSEFDGGAGDSTANIRSDGEPEPETPPQGTGGEYTKPPTRSKPRTTKK